uniref:Uncharacterized protein n=1 Tax=Apteryx owenii TaxID=8824 RepID=A0A8B9PFG0_APTOW
SLSQQARNLDLDRNKLKHITGISKLCNLKKLILSKNEIVDFPDEIQSLVYLEKLELNQNQIRVIPEGIFSHLSRLKHLRLNNNRLCALPRDLAACQGSLQYLNLSNNLFRTFPQPVLQLTNLQELHVQNNALRQLPKELFQGQSLKMFKANGNPLKEPPSEVCAGGLQQILNYFTQLQDCSGQEDRRVKTMFLGSPASVGFFSWLVFRIHLMAKSGSSCWLKKEAFDCCLLESMEVGIGNHVA